MKGFLKMYCRDSKVAVFYSPHMAGDVRVEYCSHSRMLVLKYRTKCGVLSCCCYDVTKPSEMRSMVLDAIDLAARPLKERD